MSWGRLTPPPPQQVVLWKYPSKCRVNVKLTCARQVYQCKSEISKLWVFISLSYDAKMEGVRFFSICLPHAVQNWYLGFFFIPMWLEVRSISWLPITSQWENFQLPLFAIEMALYSKCHDKTSSQWQFKHKKISSATPPINCSGYPGSPEVANGFCAITSDWIKIQTRSQFHCACLVKTHRMIHHMIMVRS